MPCAGTSCAGMVGKGKGSGGVRTTVINKATGVLRPVRQTCYRWMQPTAPQDEWLAGARWASYSAQTTHSVPMRMRCTVLPSPQGRLTLLLGPPGAGKSVLLRRLTGQLEESPMLELSGEVRFLAASWLNVSVLLSYKQVEASPMLSGGVGAAGGDVWMRGSALNACTTYVCHHKLQWFV